jgi:hypothetical protein
MLPQRSIREPFFWMSTQSVQSTWDILMRTHHLHRSHLLAVRKVVSEEAVVSLKRLIKGGSYRARWPAAFRTTKARCGRRPSSCSTWTLDRTALHESKHGRVA